MSEQFSAPALMHPTPALVLSAERIELIKKTVADGASDVELELFLYQAQRTGLDPLTRQIYAVFRWQKVQDKKTGAWRQERRMTIQTAIDGFRLVAERTGKYAGQLGPLWCGPDGEWKDVWLGPSAPAAAKVGILRSDFREPLWAVADWKSYVQKNAQGVVTTMWQRMAPTMIAKCAEALGLRRAFPQELSGLYTQEEMGQSDDRTDHQGDNNSRAGRAGAGPEPADRSGGLVTADGLQQPNRQPDSASPAPSVSSGHAPAALDPARKLTIKEIQALENEAREAADRGRDVFNAFWARVNRNAQARAVIEGLRTDILERWAKFEAQEEAANEAAEAAEHIDPETGEIS